MTNARTERSNFLGCAQSQKSAARAGPKQGQLLSVKAIAYLVLSLIAIVSAFMLLAAIYNAFVGGSPEKQDAALLAAVINEMIADDRPYMQSPILLRLENKRIVGFDSDAPVSIIKEEKVIGRTPGEKPTQQTKLTFERGNCGNAPACICTSNEAFSISATKVAVKSCFMLNAPKQSGQARTITLATNYYPYENSVQDKTATVAAFSAQMQANMPQDLEGKYTEFIIDRENIDILRRSEKVISKSKTATTGAPAGILPLLIEKITDKDGNVLITVMPDSDQMRAREAYLYQCPANSENNCGVEPRNTFIESQSADRTTACSASALQPKCNRETIPKCIDNEIVTTPCRCKDRVALYGVCFANGEMRRLRCDIVNECKDYCSQHGGSNCDEASAQAFCTHDPCQVAKLGQRCMPNENYVFKIGGEINTGYSTLATPDFFGTNSNTRLFTESDYSCKTVAST